MRNITLTLSIALVMGMAFLTQGCQSEGSSGRTLLSPAAAKEPPTFPGAGHFVAQITNPYMNFAPGRTFTYRSETSAGTEINTVLVTGDTKILMDVETTVVHD